MLVNMNKNCRDGLCYTQKMMDCSPTVPSCRPSTFGKLWPNKICFQPPLPFLEGYPLSSPKRSGCVSLSSDFKPRSHEFVTTTETKKIKKMDFSFDNPSIQFECFGLVLKRWQACIGFWRVPTVYMRKLYCKASPQDYYLYAAINMPSIAIKVTRENGLM